MYKWRDRWIRGEEETRFQKVCHEKKTEIGTERQRDRQGEGGGGRRGHSQEEKK